MIIFIPTFQGYRNFGYLGGHDNMGFPTNIADEVLVRCGRHCCLCGEYVGQKIELHHIKQVADGGDDSAENCIPLCFNCHAEVKSYNLSHPKGRKFTEKELKGHRDKCYARYSLDANAGEGHISDLCRAKRIFSPIKNDSLIQGGYPEHDKLCPVFLGNIILVAGYTGMKKSTYLYHIVNCNIKNGYRVSYCCLKDNPLDVGIQIIAEKAHVKAEYIKRGLVSEDDWIQLTNKQVSRDNENMALIPYSESSKSDSILSIVENSGAEIVVVDDFNGILLDDSVSVERFLYQLKSIAIQSGTVVFVIYNLNIPFRRPDKHPMLNDFPSDCYYRLFDIVHLLYKADHFYQDDDKDILEVNIVKGTPEKPQVIKLYAPDNITGVFPILK